MNLEVRFMVGKRSAAALAAVILGFLAFTASAATNALLGWSATGLHETDGSDFSVYLIAPPYSTIHAQLVIGGLLVTNPAGYTVTYEAVADSKGSINSTSAGKGNFYQYAQKLFGQALAADQGLSGFGMPGTSNVPQTMSFDATQNCYSAVGIPMTPYDDKGQKNYYPTLKLVARDVSGTVLASTVVSVPVTDEMDCRACHASGSRVEARPPSGWAWNVDPQRDYKLNILRSHDDHQLGSSVYAAVLAEVGYNQAGLVATVVKDGHPVSCVRCHASNALPGTGATGMRPLTQLMHTKHSYVSDPVSGSYLTSLTNSTACLLCHAGPENRLMRGLHHNVINPDGTLAMQCESCHGTIGAVGAPARQGWIDEPLCQSCHTGTVLTNRGSLRYTTVFDATGQTRLPADLTYSTLTNTSSPHALFGTAHGHGNLNCAACHGPAHAEWLSTQANDNQGTLGLQGSAAGPGVLTDCLLCHPTMPAARTSGPHGMHPIDTSWAYSHDSNSRTSCQACHGSDYRGTAMSWSQEKRNYTDINQALWHGFEVGCYLCHGGPNGTDGGNANPPPTVTSLAASTIAGTPVTTTLVGAAFNGGPVTFRAVTQPVHGTVSVSGSSATFFPDPTFVGSDSFTYASWDGSANSSLGTVALTASSGTCVLSASALVPTAAFPNSPVSFRGLATLSQCASAISYDWDFGDGSAHGSGTNVSHLYSVASDYNWTLKVTAGTTTQTIQGVVTISPTLGQPLTITTTSLGFGVNLAWPADAIPTSLESSTDLSQPFPWSQDVDPVYFDGTNNNVQIWFPATQQFFRVRRVP